MLQNDRSDPPDLARAKQLLDQLKHQGFQFGRIEPGEDGPLLGRRVSQRWTDTIYIEGFSRNCAAWRQRNSSLIVPHSARSQDHRISGSALSVLGEVLAWETER